MVHVREPLRLDRSEVVRIIGAHLEALFPRNCPKCGTRFADLADYLRVTKHLGEPVTFDDVQDLPTSPLGTMSLANCSCGTTLSLGSKGMPAETLLQLMRWARDEAGRRGITIGRLLAEVRDEIDRVTLAAVRR